MKIMKTLIYIICFTGMMFTVGCSNKQVEAVIAGSYNGTLSADGVLNYLGGDHPYWMTAHDDDNNIEIFWDVDDLTEGTHYLGNYPYMDFVDSNTIPNTRYSTYTDSTVYAGAPKGESGTIIVEEYTDELLKGEFNFIAKVSNSTKSVTVNGTFNIPIE